MRPHLKDTFVFVCCYWLPFAFCNNVTTKDPVWAIRHLFPKADISADFTPKNVTIEQGTATFLPCKFRVLANHQVSWFRRRDWHILTTGLLTYTSDERFSVLHPPDSDSWTLQLKFAQLRDSGIYECQLSTGTGSTSQFVNLKVVLPEATIIGEPEYHVQTGSTIKLTCIIEKSQTVPDFIFWYRNDSLLNYDRSRGGINVATRVDPAATSVLTIDNATIGDSGNYSCVAPNTQTAHTNVFVSQGDKMAAIQRRKSSANCCQNQTFRNLFLAAFFSSFLNNPNMISFFLPFHLNYLSPINFFR